jgi:hypothetical protein
LVVQEQNRITLPHVLEQNNAKLELLPSVMVAVVPLQCIERVL